MPVYKLLTYEQNGMQSVGLLFGSCVYELTGTYKFLKEQANQNLPPLPKQNPNMVDLLDEWDFYCDTLGLIVNGIEDTADQIKNYKGICFIEQDINIKAPLLYPHKVLNAGANYYKHNREMLVEAFNKEDRQPFFFYKGTKNVIIGQGDTIKLPRVSNYVDWECELAVVIGRRAKDVPASKALEFIAGYTIMNDISARDKMVRPGELFFFDWFANKGNDTFAPMGPYLVPKQFIPEPQNLGVQCLVNGELMQDSSTSDMIWTIDELIEYLSAVVTLEPGDVIATGTPHGVGMAKGLTADPGEFSKLAAHMYAGGGIFLKDGDYVTSKIEGIGILENPVIDLKIQSTSGS